MEKRWNEIMQYWQKHSPSWLFLGVGAGFGFGIIIGFLVGQQTRFGLENWFWNGFWPELLGMTMTIFVIGNIQVYLNKEQYKKQLIRQARSRSNDIAIGAVDALRTEGWLSGSGGLLANTSMIWANLEYANLREANLDRVNLSQAILTKADLRKATLRDSIFYETKWLDAQLMLTDFSKAELINAEFKGKNLSGVNFSEANLTSANLKDATLHKATLQNTILLGADLQYTDLMFVDMSGADIYGMKVYGMKLSHVTLPDKSFHTSLSFIELQRFGCIIEEDEQPNTQN